MKGSFWVIKSLLIARSLMHISDIFHFLPQNETISIIKTSLITHIHLPQQNKQQNIRSVQKGGWCRQGVFCYSVPTWFLMRSHSLSTLGTAASSSGSIWSRWFPSSPQKLLISPSVRCATSKALWCDQTADRPPPLCVRRQGYIEVRRKNSRAR